MRHVADDRINFGRGCGFGALGVTKPKPAATLVNANAATSVAALGKAIRTTPLGSLDRRLRP